MNKIYLAVIFILTSLLFSACSSQPVVVEGRAMMPTFNNGDRILIDKTPGELKRSDVITFLYPKDRTKSYIKRIIGLPGETIEIRSGKVYINEQILDESYIDENLNQTKMNMPPKKIAEYNYFVMGDNRDNSSDSRSWGTVDINLIKGKYYLTYSKAKE
ncbi:MAG: signal peptidase I [Pyrinomonadaceae bacterium]